MHRPWDPSLEDFSLDEDQRSVLECPPEASGVVVGAPGSGKTTLLTARVVELLSAGLTPEQILVLTPTRATATRLRDELALSVRVATAGSLARSVSAFAFHVVRAVEVSRSAERPRLLTGPDEDGVIQDLLAGDAADEREGRLRWPQSLPADVRSTRSFRAEVRAFLAEMADHGISPAALSARAAADGHETWTALASFAEEYASVRAAMRGAHRDAAGLLREAVGLIRTLPTGSAEAGMLNDLRVVLVDDAQELTLGGVDLMEALESRGIAIMAFGDPDVGSGAFRGATPENFARLLVGRTVHILRGRHRGTAAQQALIDTVTVRVGAGGVVAHRRAPSSAEGDDVAPGAKEAPTPSVQTFGVRSAGEEYDTVARLLREAHVLDGVPWSSCAVIAHDARQVTAWEDELAARDVPAGGTGATRTLASSSAVRDLLHVVAVGATEPVDWHPDDVNVVLGAAGLDAVDLRRLRTALRHAALRRGDVEIVSGPAAVRSALEHPLEFDAIDSREGRRGATLARTLEAIHEQHGAGAGAHELLWTAWENSGRERIWGEAARGSGPLAEQAGRDLDAVVALFQAAKRHGERDDGTSPLEFVRSILASDVVEDRLSAPVPASAVRVMTPAAALGEEFEVVVVAGVQDGVWPNLRLRGGVLDTWRLGLPDGSVPDTLDRRRAVLHDELRLFIRAISRARQRLIVTAVDDDDTGPSPLFEFLPPMRPAPPEAAHPLSLRGLVAQHRRTLTSTATPTAARDAAAQLAILAAEGVDGADPTEWYGISDVTRQSALYDLEAEPARLSPSKLQAIDDCALNWVIGDLGGGAGSVTAGVGTLLHAALEDAPGTDAEEIWQLVADRWGELEFEADWIERTELARARDLVGRLARYLRDTEAAGTRLLEAEPRFAIDVEVPSAAHPAIINGVMDRVELQADGTVVIVDLKTGRSESTSASAATANAQLSAYQLAFEHGALPAAAGHPSGGAKLLVLKKTRNAEYATPAQPPFDDETRQAFLGRIDAAVQVMGARAFLAPYEAHCRDDHTYGLCRIHTVGAVSAT